MSVRELQPHAMTIVPLQTLSPSIHGTTIAIDVLNLPLSSF